MPSRPIEILLIEDSPSDADITLSNLRNSKLSNNIYWVADGDTAMDYLLRQGDYVDATRPDLILLDLNLPGMDGREVLQEIKRDSALKIIPVVILTTSADEVDILRSYELAANCYITKPVDIQQFIQVIQVIQDFWLTVVKLPLP